MMRQYKILRVVVKLLNYVYFYILQPEAGSMSVADSKASSIPGFGVVILSKAANRKVCLLLLEFHS